MTSHAHSLAEQTRVIGWVDGQPVSLDLLELRLAVLRSGPGAAALPREGTQEARQLRRWTAHVLFTELLCLATAGRLAISDSAGAPLDALSAVQLGSITAAAWQGCPAVGAVCRTLFPATPVAAGFTNSHRPVAQRWFRVSHSLTSDGDVLVGSLLPMGWTTLDDLPTPLAQALRDAPCGELVGPVASALGRHLARVDDIEERPAPALAPDHGDQLREFTLWLERRRTESLSVAAGFEHPGDPRQPDNTHRH